MTLVDLLIVALAASGIVHCWFRAELFAQARSYIDSRVNYPQLRSWWQLGLVSPWELLWELLRCPYCLSFHASFACAYIWYWHMPLLYWAILGFAAQRLLWCAQWFLPLELQLTRQTVLTEPDTVDNSKVCYYCGGDCPQHELGTLDVCGAYTIDPDRIYSGPGDHPDEEDDDDEPATLSLRTPTDFPDELSGGDRLQHDHGAEQHPGTGSVADRAAVEPADPDQRQFGDESTITKNPTSHD